MTAAALNPRVLPDSAAINQAGHLAIGGCDTLDLGRWITATAGVTLYTVGTVKRAPDGATIAAVDGGMTDNMRVALYGADYEMPQDLRHSVFNRNRRNRDCPHLDWCDPHR